MCVIQEDKKKFEIENYDGSETDMVDVEIENNEAFWKAFPFPPDAEFYLKMKSELESHFKVALETQFKVVNQGALDGTNYLGIINFLVLLI